MSFAEAPWLQRFLALGLLGFGLLVAATSLGGLISLIVGPGAVSDETLLLGHLAMNRPGYQEPTLLGRELGSTDRHRRLRFQTGISTANGSQLCHGALVYHYGQPSTLELAWDSAQCTDAAETVRLARQILAGGSLPHSFGLYGEERTLQVIALLRSWLETGAIDLIDVPGSLNRDLLLH